MSLLVICLARCQSSFNKHSNCANTSNYCEGFEVLTAVAMKSPIFGIKRRVVRCKSSDLSKEHVASIFEVEE
jgi:hypothetical protein